MDWFLSGYWWWREPKAILGHSFARRGKFLFICSADAQLLYILYSHGWNDVNTSSIWCPQVWPSSILSPLSSSLRLSWCFTSKRCHLSSSTLRPEACFININTVDIVSLTFLPSNPVLLSGGRGREDAFFPDTSHSSVLLLPRSALFHLHLSFRFPRIN